MVVFTLVKYVFVSHSVSRSLFSSVSSIVSCIVCLIIICIFVNITGSSSVPLKSFCFVNNLV